MFGEQLRQDPAVKFFISVLTVTILVGLPFSLLPSIYPFMPWYFGPNAVYKAHGIVPRMGAARAVDVLSYLGTRLLLLTIMVSVACGLILWAKRQMKSDAGGRMVKVETVSDTKHVSSSEAALSCPYCQETIQENFRYCPACKREIKPICRKCSKELQSGWRACPYCGKETHMERQST